MARTPDPTAETVGFPLSLGELFQQQGWPRLTGRVIGELLLAEPPYLSSAELCERIGCSKSHLSAAIQHIDAMGMLERFGMPGSRKDHYRLTHDAFAVSMRKAVEPSRRMAAAAERALSEVDEGSRAAEEIGLMRDFYVYFTRRLKEIVEEFEAGAR